MPIRFHASVVHTSEVEGVLRIMLSVDETLESERYLMIQRLLTPSVDDIRRGMNEVYIETCGQGWSWYGHIEAFRLFPKRIQVQLDAVAAAEIRDDGAVDVSFDLPLEEFARLRRALQRAFDGRPYYAEAAA
jgi:hypothetical protein